MFAVLGCALCLSVMISFKRGLGTDSCLSAVAGLTLVWLLAASTAGPAPLGAQLSKVHNLSEVAHLVSETMFSWAQPAPSLQVTAFGTSLENEQNILLY